MFSRLSFFLLTAASTLAPMSAEEIRICASDLLADFITAPLESYGAEHDIQFDVVSIGSLPALDRLRAGEVDMAIIAVPERDTVPRDEFQVYPFAYDIAVVAVNESNPIDEVSLTELGGIFGTNEELIYTSWGNLGLFGWESRMIKALAGPTEQSISLELFKSAVLKAGPMKSSVLVVKDSEVEGLLVSDAASIAILTRLPKNKKVKALMISSTQDGPAFGPTDDNVYYGDYPVRLSFYITYHKRDDAKMKVALRVLLGEEVADKLRENDLFALPSTVRRKLIIDLDLGE
jgi:ABC-type phosphate transport system substrate-binding protein